MSRTSCLPLLPPFSPPADHSRGRQSTWVLQSTYWLTVFPLRGSSALFDLAQIVSLVLVWFRTKLFGRTPREIREVRTFLFVEREVEELIRLVPQWTKPPTFDYAVYFSNHLLMVAVRLLLPCAAGARLIELALAGRLRLRSSRTDGSPFRCCGVLDLRLGLQVPGSLFSLAGAMLVLTSVLRAAHVRLRLAR